MKNLYAVLCVTICFLLSGCATFEPGEARSSTDCCPPDSGSADVPYAARWLPPNERGTSLPAHFRVTDQHGTAYTLEKFKGRPLALSFFYTSCQNPNKCLRVTRQMAALGNKLDSLQMEKQVNLALVSYEPEIDTPQKLKQYAETIGLDPREHIFLLQIDPQFRDELLDRLRVAVNFNDGRVNIHAIQLFLLDSQTRVARTYGTLLWDNEAVLHDIKRLLAEPANRVARFFPGTEGSGINDLLSLTSWSDCSPNGATGGTAEAIGLNSSDAVYIGGTFTNFEASSRPKIARLVATH